MKYLYEILRLFFRPKCSHKWEIINTGKTSIYEGNDINRLPIQTINVRELQCIHCGDIKFIKNKV